MDFSYNRLVLIGHCQSGRNLIERLIKFNYPQYVIENHCFYNQKHIDHNFINFLYTKIPNGKILISRCNDPTFLHKTNISFNEWKFIQIDRNILDSVASSMIVYKMNMIEAINWLDHQILNQSILYEKIKYRTFKTGFDELFQNTYYVINKIFKFIEMETPRKEIIEEYASKEITFKFMRDNKCEIGEEANLIGMKKEIMENIRNETVKHNRL